ncbi:MAG: methylmalonyl Co-A mutase-associated GTPase MeaB [Bryobacterales bacterium]|nr:methylmalonyl Co-A mutase-associated GTPase MeaB [Bryobacterales bacterium]
MTATAERIVAGDLRTLARAATDIENGRPEARTLLSELASHTGRALVAGFTGPAGAGKSTLLDQLVAEVRRDNRTVAVLAVDPSSPYTGGAILGDRIRLERHYTDPGVFIRSVASRGTLGGVAAATSDLISLCDAAGRDVIFVETVGVGQAETEIARVAQIVVVVLVPSMGDHVQALKAGLLETADLFVINKSDLPGAEQLERDLEQMQSLSNGAKPPILQTIARDGTGVRALLDTLNSHPRRERHRKSRIRIAVANYNSVVRALRAHGVRVIEESDGQTVVPHDDVLLELIKEQEC